LDTDWSYTLFFAFSAALAASLWSKTMENKPINIISKWWLRTLATMLGLTLPGIALLLRNNLENYLSSATPALLAQLSIILLAVIGILVAYIILERPWLTWDVPTGTWVNRFTGIRYCGTCKANEKIPVPLKNEITGWRCVACNTFRTDPERKHLQQSRGRQLISPGIGRV
jgi:hypothetical protein